MKRKLILVVAQVILLIIGNPLCLWAQEYTLQDLYRIALQTAETIKLSEENLVIAETNKEKALSLLIPKFSAYGSYTRFTEEKYTPSSTLAPGVILPGSLLQPTAAGTWGIRLDQSFSLGGRELKALGIAKDTIVKSQKDLQAIKEQYLLNVSSAYYDVLKTQKALEIADSNLERLTQYKNAAQKRLRVGEVTKTTLLRAEAELSGALSDRLRAQNNIELAKSILARIVGIDRHFELRETPLEEMEPLPLKDYQQKAFAERADLKSLEIQKKTAEDQVSFARGAYWPNLSIAGVYGHADQDPISSSLNRESVYGQVALNFPFFEGGLRYAEVKEAQAKERQAIIQYEDLKKTISIEVESAYLDLMFQKGVLKFLGDQLIFAKDNMQAVTKQFEFGLASSLDVIDANNLLVSSEQKLADAVYNYQVAVLRMEKVTGEFLKMAIRGQ